MVRRRSRGKTLACIVGIALVLCSMMRARVALVPAPSTTSESAEDPALHCVVGVLGSAFALPIVFALAQHPTTAPFTWKLLDEFLAIFLAVIWFSAFGASVQGLTVEILHFLVLYLGIYCVFWRLRRKPVLLHAICSIACHFVSFSAMKMGDTMQRGSSSAVVSLVCCILLFLGILSFWRVLHAVMGKISGQKRKLEDVQVGRPGAKKAKVMWHRAQHFLHLNHSVSHHSLPHPHAVPQENDAVIHTVSAPLQHTKVEEHKEEEISDEEAIDEFYEATDDLSWDVAGMCLAFTTLQATRHAVFGELGDLEEGEGFGESRAEGLFFLTLGVACVLIFHFLSNLPRLPKQGFWLVRNLKHVAMNTSSMASAWGFLAFARYVVLQLLFPGFSELFQTLVFAMTMTVGTICALIFVQIVTVTGRHFQFVKAVVAIMKSGLRPASLMLALSWEKAFDGAYNASVMKPGFRLALAAIFPMILGPIYINFLKPIACKYSEE